MIRIFGCMVCVALLIFFAVGVFYAYDAYLVSPASSAISNDVIIDSGTSVQDIAQLLSQQEIIDSPKLFELYVRINNIRLQAGTFSLKPSMNYASVVDILSRSIAQEVQLTIPEGFTSEQIGTVVREAIPHITFEQWEQEASVHEGYLFPDTYRFFTDATAVDVVSKMRATFDVRVASLHIPPHELKETVILASIIEREVRSSDDMKMVADIFLKRVEAGIPLQADSTVNYITGGTRPSISIEDTRIESLFNTYKNVGLPPAPISNPGINAIVAVRQPTPNEYYYFLTDTLGEVHYSSTFKDHVKNKFLYIP